MINLKNNSNNYHLTSALDGVVFDITGTGVLRQIAWTEANAEVAFLALDRNGNGQIDNGSELFGDATWLSNGQRALHGFEALVDLDGGPAVSDGQLDRNDASFSHLRLWLDRNHNGISESPELLTLAAAGVNTIFTSFRVSRRTDKHGNTYRYVGTALVHQRNELVRRKIVDVFLRIVH